ncbi:MAG: hypothetical protein MZV64_24355 [Ignavibacteriales bacterium]|nr:hypothetical protein [Ignavibacteriales bacterium]
MSVTSIMRVGLACRRMLDRQCDRELRAHRHKRHIGCLGDGQVRFNDDNRGGRRGLGSRVRCPDRAVVERHARDIARTVQNHGGVDEGESLVGAGGVGQGTQVEGHAATDVHGGAAACVVHCRRGTGSAKEPATSVVRAAFEGVMEAQVMKESPRSMVSTSRALVKTPGGTLAVTVYSTISPTATFRFVVKDWLLPGERLVEVRVALRRRDRDAVVIVLVRGGVVRRRVGIGLVCARDLGVVDVRTGHIDRDGDRQGLGLPRRGACRRSKCPRRCQRAAL